MKALITNIIALLSLIPMMCFGQTITTVQADGIGTSDSLALDNAFRVAISQVATTLIESETETINEDVIKDNILSVSNGFIKDYKILEPAKKDVNGYFTIKIQANVKHDELAVEIKRYSKTSLTTNWGDKTKAIQQEQDDKERRIRLREEQQQKMGAFIVKLIDDYMKIWKFDIIDYAPGEGANDIKLVIQKSLSRDAYISQFVLPTQQKLKALGIISKRIKGAPCFEITNSNGSRTAYWFEAFLSDKIISIKNDGFSKYVYNVLGKRKYILRIQIFDAQGKVLNSRDIAFMIHRPYRMRDFALESRGDLIVIFPSLNSKSTIIKSQKTITMHVFEPNKITDVAKFTAEIIHIDSQSPHDEIW